MKKMIMVIVVIVLAALISGFVEDTARRERNAKIDATIIRPALYGEEYLDRKSLLAGYLIWHKGEKLHAERITENEVKVYIPKAMYKIKARLASLEH